jgi:ribitol-5-phosphate 2-dehydrogenase (NADP+) / D-ribitol-5-phosphate cytidylyltransferase
MGPMSAPRNVVVILAGGTGQRMGLDLPKQLLKVSGRTILEHTISVFDAHPEVDSIIIAMATGHLDVARQIVRHGDYAKVVDIIEGGTSRNETTAKALAAIPHVEGNVLFHDAVRPLVSHRIISDCFAALEMHEAVDVAIPSADTIIEVHPNQTIRDIPPRSALRRGQTPQGFRLTTIREAYDVALRDHDLQATDDCTIVLRYRPGTPIAVVPGDERNLKVTEPIDLFLADKLFQLSGRDQPTIRGDAAYTEALTDKIVVLFGGSYGIGRSIADVAEYHGARVHTFSRSATRTHVERRDDVREALEQVAAKEGRIDFVANAAAVLPTGALTDATDDVVHTSTDVNYLGPIYVAQESFPHLCRTEGSLLLFTSSSYTRGRAGYSLYSSAKAAVVNLTQALSDEWAPAGVRVNCINPERTSTPMRRQAFGDEPPETLLDAEEVARASLSVLTSPDTGHIIDLRRETPFE